MRKFILFCALGLAACYLCMAQPQRGVKKYDTDKYPTVSFIYNTPNPEVLGKSMFTLKDENDANVNFDFAVQPKKDTCYNKSILFIWEDMASHSKQSENTRKLLSGFFDQTNLDTNTRLNVAVFNRKSDYDRNVLKPLLTDFSSNTSLVATAVKEYKNSSRTFGENEYSKATDLYMAINEGITLLKAEPSDHIGIIVVITAGLNMKAAGASTELESVRRNAEDANIPIYVVKYHQIAGNTPEVNSLAESTYGTVLLLTDKYVDNTISDLQTIYKNLDSRCHGQDYLFSFKTTAKRDGKPHPLKLFVNKVDQGIPPFMAPEMTLGIWVKEHMAIFVLLVVLLACLIALTIWLIVRSVNNRKMREAENEARIQEQLNEEEVKRRRWEEEQRQKEEAQRRAEAQKAREAEDERLLQLMQTKNIYPRLQCSVGADTFTCSINSVATRIGRNENNDVVLPNQTVSGYHAEIRFNGTSFEIFNRSQSYTRGIIVNGQFYQQCVLKSGDKIGLGEAVITFYV